MEFKALQLGAHETIRCFHIPKSFWKTISSFCHYRTESKLILHNYENYFITAKCSSFNLIHQNWIIVIAFFQIILFSSDLMRYTVIPASTCLRRKLTSSIKFKGYRFGSKNLPLNRVSFKFLFLLNRKLSFGDSRGEILLTSRNYVRYRFDWSRL